ncbi:hypothetical protein CYLTODRAFT_490299 [Cylindrobasidium torrendii FP15055 ss-10]|uniref:ADF-H domain-containing protein n=1 Tax=Cylindrobasidium torrendii FP15055 ss-10 TaxID=1314674 RepID=A0A0D7BCC6_9AGAR|nr:hypothetical protein CYLTODRAFT_490299 [Cylindrobasidium torrendii FP15055 ss-10]
MSGLLDIDNPDRVREVFNAVTDGVEANWLLLQYANSGVTMVGHGKDGLVGLKKTMLAHTSTVQFAYMRNPDGAFVVINFVPRAVSLAQRARVLVCSRRVATSFTAEHYHSTLTLDHLSNLTPNSIAEALRQPDGEYSIQSTPSLYGNDNDNNDARSSMTVSTIPSDTTDYPPVISSRMIHHQPHRSFTETYAPERVATAPSPIRKTGSMFSSLLHRRKGRSSSGTSSHRYESTQDYTITPYHDEHLPPPPPAKDGRGFQSMLRAPAEDQFYRQPSDFGVISRDDFSTASGSDDEHLDDRPEPPKTPPPPPVLLPLDGKWAASVNTTVIADPAERARRRQLAKEQKEREEAQAAREEMQRQFQSKLRKDEIRRQEQEDERRRQRQLQEELRRSAEARRRKEQEDREEELRRKQELELRKITERERRMEEHKRLDQWRTQQARIAEDNVKREEAAKMRENNERKKQIAQVQAKVKSSNRSEDLVTGWLTMQTSENIAWRRRYYRLIGNTLFLYRSPKDMPAVLDEINLKGKLRGLREWNEGYEELKAIPHSFAVEFKDARGSWQMFCDSEEDKIKLLGLLHFAAGL